MQVIADESDDFAMKVCGDQMNFYLKALEENYMIVADLKFSFTVLVGRDGKWMVRSHGTSGQNSDFNCVRCFSHKDDIDSNAPPRTIEKNTELSTYAKLNPECNRIIQR